MTLNHVTKQSEKIKVYLQAERMGESVNVDPSKPRSCARQRNRPNAAAENIEDWYRINVAIPFIDHIITELDSQFSGLAKTVSTLLGLVPLNIHTNEVIDLTEIKQLYFNDLPTPETLEQELSRWKHKFQSYKEKPSNCYEALKHCDSQIFPNIHVLLQIACTIPVTSCECERDGSILRHLNTYKRSSMTNERLTNLALMTIHYNHVIDLDKVSRYVCTISS